MAEKSAMPSVATAKGIAIEEGAGGADIGWPIDGASLLVTQERASHGRKEEGRLFHAKDAKRR
jgi:hypothetical protein